MAYKPTPRPAIITDDLVDEETMRTTWPKGTRVEILKVIGYSPRLTWYRVRFPDGSTDNMHSRTVKEVQPL